MDSTFKAVNLEIKYRTRQATLTAIRNVNFEVGRGQIIGLVGITSDVTSRKGAETDLRKFKLGLDRSTAAIFITDLNGVITYVNPADDPRNKPSAQATPPATSGSSMNMKK